MIKNLLKKIRDKLFMNIIREELDKLKKSIIIETDKEILLINARVGDNVRKLLTAYHINSQTFPKFKGIHKGQCIVIVGAGPSVNKFVPINNAIYIGLNRAFLLNTVQFDYLFSIDKAGINDYYDAFFTYRNGKCIKFIGDQDIMKSNEHKKYYQIPEDIIHGEQIYRYVTTCGAYLTDKLSYHLESEPLGNFTTVSLQAFQFALYTQPSKIYLVGIDCTSSGHFTGEKYYKNARNDIEFESTKNAQKSLKDWQEAKTFAECYYPTTEIISVNPVNLRGVFTDWDQDEEQNRYSF